ncbi:MAG TPA: TSUP family transporter [Xanthobacteraceae bacterium]|nr:TSUP family transporter [Xanthobacteraceae bacterium]
MIDLDSIQLIVFLLAAFAASLITGLVGFAFDISAAGPWLHVLTPAQSATLIVGYGLVVQGASVWKLRAAIRLHRLLPFLVGSAVGVPLGIALLRWLTPTELRVGTGAFLIAYSLHGLLRLTLRQVKRGGAIGDTTAASPEDSSAARPAWRASW